MVVAAENEFFVFGADAAFAGMNFAGAKMGDELVVIFDDAGIKNLVARHGYRFSTAGAGAQLEQVCLRTLCDKNGGNYDMTAMAGWRFARGEKSLRAYPTITTDAT